MAKLVKFNLLVDGQKCKRVEDIQENFNLLDLLEHFESGKLEKWLKVRKYQEFEVVKSVDKSLTLKEIAQKLCEIFTMEIEQKELLDEIEIYEVLKNSNAEDSKNDILFIQCQKENKKLQNRLNLQHLTFKDKETGLVWATEDDGKKYRWDDIGTVAQRLNEENYGGYDDWRVPNKEELEAVYYYKDGLNFASYSYWSSSEFVSDSSYAWNVYIHGGDAYYISKSNEYYVRCVRGRQ
ncbi:MAG: DUF1566 domain-containing protein [Campylobacterota bacterium]|nr:DUF1566 domain-containing protein [Campylobacterota bacterium]